MSVVGTLKIVDCPAAGLIADFNANVPGAGVSIEAVPNDAGTGIRVRALTNGRALETIPGVLKVTDRGNLQELRLAGNADPQQILTELMRRGRVDHFELAHPSLHDIFIRIATPEEQSG